MMGGGILRRNVLAGGLCSPMRGSGFAEIGRSGEKLTRLDTRVTGAVRGVQGIGRRGALEYDTKKQPSGTEFQNHPPALFL